MLKGLRGNERKEMMTRLENEALNMINSEKGYVIKPKKTGWSKEHNKEVTRRRQETQEFFEVFG